MAELDIYEKNLSKMISDYETIHANYTNSLRLKNSVESKNLLLKLNSLNQEILFLIEEISHKIDQTNKNAKNNEFIYKKLSDLNALSSKMHLEETKVNALLNETVNLDGKNETLRLQTKSSMYYNTAYLIIIIILGVLFIRMIVSTESDPIENIVLLLGLVWLFYTFRATLIGWFSNLTSSIGNISYSWLQD